MQALSRGSPRYALFARPRLLIRYHSLGGRERSPDGILDVFHVTAQGVIAGANMILVDFHPAPAKALVDGPQALTPEELPYYLEDVALAREAYEKRRELAAKNRKV